jgi:hypothetical protein
MTPHPAIGSALFTTISLQDYVERLPLVTAIA